MTVVPIRRALVSVFDKSGLDELARGLASAGVDLVSTGSTAATIRSAGVDVTDVSAVTGFPEVLDGRVKTLHPAVHAGILADRAKPSHLATLALHGIEPFDLVVANLYPFAATVARGDVGDDEVIEMIDVGGPTMVRAAAKNHAAVAVVVDPADYPALLDAAAGGGFDLAARRGLAAKAFAHTAAYDAQVAHWFERDQPFPAQLSRTWRKAQDLRYGENPHQTAAYYVEEPRRGLGGAEQLGGKELSYNNLLDADAAWGAAVDFDEPCVVIVKHTNPAGLAVGTSLSEAYPRALAGDPVSAFGGIVAVNRPMDAATAKQVVEVFTEVVVAPGYDDEALDVLRTKANLRVLSVPDTAAAPRTLRSVAGGLLVADADVAPEDETAWTVPTATAVDDATMDELRFAWRAAKHAKSNAIVLTRDRAVVGVGAGQMSRVDSVRIAVDKSGGRAVGAVLASDAFFPFPDGPLAALDAGVVAMISPGGSVRDAEVVEACDARGVPMVFTGRRHFRH